MGHRKKPGTPKRTTIPAEIVSAVTKRLLTVFKMHRYDIDHHVFIIPQQCYLYVEAERKPFDSTEPHPPSTRSSTVHIPLGRLKFMGSAETWLYQPYRWADEFWDDQNGETGTPEDLMLSMMLDTLK